MYEITRKYIQFGNSRSGIKLLRVGFIVAHDTGDEGATARNEYNYFNNQQPEASAHAFIDDKYILEIIPLDEKAWHVIYDKQTDNRLFGDDANDIGIGVELCWGGNIDFREAYKRYVWYHAYLCHKFNLDPSKHIVSHKILDPGRKTDPDNALNRYGITWNQFLKDVEKEYINQGVEGVGDMSELHEPMKLNSREWSDIEKTYSMYYQTGILTSDYWRKLATAKEMTYAQNIYLTTTCQGRFIEQQLKK